MYKESEPYMERAIYVGSELYTGKVSYKREKPYTAKAIND